MGIAVLGPLTCDDGIALGRRDRAVLAALALRVGRPVPVDQLVEAVWGAAPPRSAHKSLQGCIFRIRRTLGAGLVETSPQGYRLVLPADEVDAQRFERLVGRGRELLALGEPERAAFVVADALELWRGRAFEDIEAWDLAAFEGERLDELRLEAEELRVEASLRAGRHLDVLATAGAMVQSAPLRERRWQLLAQAQYQSGRQTEALRTVRRVRDLLAEQLGVDPGPELARLEEAILRQDESLTTGDPLPATGACPYRGLLPFDIEDSEDFYGRDDDIEACLQLLHSRGSVSVAGPSGSGKSSLARAGLGAALQLQGYAVVVITPGSDPMQALGCVPAPTRRTVLIVDQGEEAFSVCSDDTARAEFLAGLVRWVEQAPLVVAIRADRLSDASAYPPFARLLERGLYLLGAMSEAGLRDAVEAPARQAGLLIEAGLVDLLVGEVAGTAGALPLLSHALLETWERRERNTLTVAGYTASGGIRGAVAQSAETVYASVDPDRRLVLRDIVLRLVSGGTQGEPVRARVPRRLLAADPEHDQLIDLLVGSRLVISDAGVVEIAHEALAGAWPRLRAWLEEDLEGQRIRQHLTASADAWDSLGRPDSELYRGVRLAHALQWRSRPDTRLTPTEMGFLEAAEQTEQSERGAEQVRARAQTRLIRRLRGSLAVAMVLLVVALVAGVVALEQRDRAEDNAAAATQAERTAEARRAGARALTTDDLDESMLLAVAGVRLHDSPETQSSLLSALGRHPEVIASTELSGEEVLSFDVSPDGATVATYDMVNRVRLYDLATGERLADFQAGEPARLGWISGKVRFSPDGSILAVTMAAPARHPVALLDASSLAPLPSQPGGAGWARWQLNGFDFSNDGRRLAAIMWRVRGQDDSTRATSTWTYVWDMDALGRPANRTLVDSTGFSVALTARGDAMFTTAPLTRHDLATGRSTVISEPWGRDSVEIVEMSPTGRALGVSGDGVGVAVLDPVTGRVKRQMQSQASDAPFYLSFSDDGRRIATVEYTRREALVWEVASGRPLARVPLAENGEASDLGTNGSTLYTAGSQGSLRTWDVDGGRRFVAQVASGPANLGERQGSPAPGGRFVAYLGAESVAFLDVRTRRTTVPVSIGPGFRRAPGGAWHPDGMHFAQAAGDEIRVWDARDGTLTARAPAPGPAVSALDYSADGEALVVSEVSGRITMLDGNLRSAGRPVQLDQPVSNIAAGPDGHLAVALLGFDSASGFWVAARDHWALLDLMSGRVVREGDLGFGATDVDLSPDGRHVAIGGGPGALQVFDIATGDATTRAGPWHNTVNWVTYSRDGRRVLTSGPDATDALWDGATGELLASVTTSQRSTLASFGQDPWSVLIVDEFGGPVFEWDTRLEQAVAFACRVAGRDFTEQEWADHFGERPFQATCP